MLNPRVLVCADRPGWAIDRLAKPITERVENCDLCYFNTKEDRYLDSGYSKKGGVQYRTELANGYDIVHFHHLRAAISILGEVKARKILHIHTERDEYENVDLDRFDDIICPTQNVVNFMAERVERARVHFVPHGINLDKYVYKFRTPEPNIVGWVGRVMEHKRFDVVLNAICAAGLKMAGVGYIDDTRPFVRHSKDVKEGRDFNFSIFYPENKMADFYANLNLFVCLSKPGIEVGPLPVMEAMACGIPVITTRVGWAADHCIHGSDVWFVEEDEIKNLDKIIRCVYDDMNLRRKLRDNGIRLVSKFGLDAYTNKIKEIYAI